MPRIEESPAISQQLDPPPATLNDEDEGHQSFTDNATAAVLNLANSICAAYAALGFGSPPSSSESGVSSRSSSPHPSNKSLDVQIDDLDDATVEQYLQSKQEKSK